MKSVSAINRDILKLSIPSILANITVPLVGLADTAVAGRLGDGAALGAIAIGSMLFDLLYWNFAFLRIGTGGVTAQAYGRGSNHDAMKSLVQGLGTAVLGSLLILAIQWIFARGAFALLKCSPHVEEFARQYFFIRVWAAPATLCLFVFRGWFIGMQDSLSPMAVDVTINLTNIGFSIWLGHYTPLGFAGIAWGTLIAQYCGLALALVLFFARYRHMMCHINLEESLDRNDLRKFFGMNGNLVIRSLCFMGIYCGYTSLAATFGDTDLAVSGIIMKLFMLYSYFTDGFAYAGEALTGRFIGAKDHDNLKRSIVMVFVWTSAIGVVSMFVYWLFGPMMLRILTSDADVLSEAGAHLVWMVLMPIFSCYAFLWDGIYIGATASRQMRNAMIWACAAFFALYFALVGTLGFDALWWAYFAHLTVRSVYLSAIWPKTWKKIKAALA